MALGWVVATGVKGMATQNAPCAFQDAANQAILLNGPDHVVAATGREATACTEQR